MGLRIGSSKDTRFIGIPQVFEGIFPVRLLNDKEFLGSTRIPYASRRLRFRGHRGRIVLGFRGVKGFTRFRVTWII